MSDTEVVVSDPRFQWVNEVEVVIPEDYPPARLSEYFNETAMKLMPGRKLRVAIFDVIESVSCVETIRFIRAQSGLLLGRAGACLFGEQHHLSFLEGHMYLSFEEKIYSLGATRPYPRVYGIGENMDVIGGFEDDDIWFPGDTLLLFYDETPANV